jgi:hypothetical protein
MQRSATTFETSIWPGSAWATEPGRELHRGTEEVVIASDGLACGDTDPNLKGPLRVVERILLERLLNVDRAPDRGRGRDEHGHDAVARMFDLAAARLVKRGAHDRVVRFDEEHRVFVSETLRHRRRVDDIGEQNRARSRIVRAAVIGRQQHRSTRVRHKWPEKEFREFGRYLDDTIGRRAVREAMHLDRGLGRRCLAHAENLACRFVQPIFRVVDRKWPLRVDISNMLCGRHLRRNARYLMDVDKERHDGVSFGKLNAAPRPFLVTDAFISIDPEAPEPIRRREKRQPDERR